MIKRILVWFSLFSFLLCSVQLAAAKTNPEVLKIKLGMSVEEAHKQLKKIGKLEKEERKQQEIWALTNNPSYSHLIVAFDKEYKKVRFVTAKAREGGRRIRYSDVIDVKKATKENIGNNYKYVVDVPAKGKVPGYVITVRGQDAEYLTYFSIEIKD